MGMGMQEITKMAEPTMGPVTKMRDIAARRPDGDGLSPFLKEENVQPPPTSDYLSPHYHLFRDVHRQRRRRLTTDRGQN